MSATDDDFDPTAIATELVDAYGSGAADIAEAISRALDDPHTAMLQRVVRVWGLSTTEAASAMGGVSRQAAAQWLAGDRPVPTRRRAHLADLAAATDLLRRYVKDERIPAVVRRRAEDLRGGHAARPRPPEPHRRAAGLPAQPVRLPPTAPVILATFARPTRWLRLVDPSWEDPLDPRLSAAHGGRWTPPGGEPTLYLCADRPTARAIVARRFASSPVRPEDLDDDQAPALVHLTINADIRAVDAVSEEGLAALELPATYPLDAGGRLVEQARCQPIGKAPADAGHDGVYARSAATTDGSGRELAWFPRGRRRR